MKIRILLATIPLLGLLATTAETSRYLTITATHEAPATVQIPAGEIADLVSSVSSRKNGTVQITFLRGGGGGGPWDFGIPITGPATITAMSSRDNTASIIIRITADSSDENKTQSLTPGASQIYVTLESNTNQVYVTVGPSANPAYVSFESSTNLVDWSAATNGIYSSPNAVRFFRIRTKVLSAPTGPSAR